MDIQHEYLLKINRNRWPKPHEACSLAPQRLLTTIEAFAEGRNWLFELPPVLMTGYTIWNQLHFEWSPLPTFQIILRVTEKERLFIPPGLHPTGTEFWLAVFFYAWCCSNILFIHLKWIRPFACTICFHNSYYVRFSREILRTLALAYTMKIQINCSLVNIEWQKGGMSLTEVLAVFRFMPPIGE